MKSFFKSKQVKRAKRVAAFGVATGILSLGAGNIWQIDALTSALFGASLALLGLVAALLIIYAGKGDVPDSDFDQAINSAIENVRSKSSKEEK